MSVHFITECFLRIVFSHTAALLLTLARQGCLQGIRWQHSQASKLLLCQLLLIFACDSSHQWDSASGAELFTSLLSWSYWTTSNAARLLSWHCWGWLWCELERPLQYITVTWLSALSSHWYWHTSWSVYATEIWPWKGREGIREGKTKEAVQRVTPLYLHSSLKPSE